MSGTSKPSSISTKSHRIAQLAKEAPDMAMDLSHHMDLEWLREAHRRTRKDGAVGVDGQTAEEYAERLEENLQDLMNRAKSGRYRAPAVRRAYIPKEGGTGQRPLGIPTFEDKVLQRAVVMLLEPVYEQDFLDCSYGSRPHRSAHQAMGRLRAGMMEMGGGWVLDIDLATYFETPVHSQLQEIFRRRVRDGVLRRLIGKWLNAGVMEDGQVQRRKEGVPQGGVISPLLANLYLHEAVDVWFQGEVVPRMAGRAFMVRYVDDMVMVFEHRRDAERVLEVLPKRLERYGLALNRDKTRLVRFEHPWKRSGGGRGAGGEGAEPEAGRRPETFTFLGFTLYWGRTRRGGWSVKLQTASKRFTRGLHRLDGWLRENRHEPLAVQHRGLCQRIRGHMAYFSVRGNLDAIKRYIWAAGCRWHKWLSRRSRKARHTWDWFNTVLGRFPLPAPRVLVTRC